MRFWLIAGGFFVCGFHVSFLLAHIPGIIEGCGSSAQLAGIWLALLGVANIAGSIGAGMAVQRFRLQRILASVYAARALGIGLFVLAPKSDGVLLAFAGWMGVSYMATVPPTSALVARLYGARRLGTLFGVVMLVHQIGGFLGVWLGGLVYEQYGSFDVIWLLDVALAAVAVLLNLAIREHGAAARVPSRQRAAQKLPTQDTGATSDPRRTRPGSGPAGRSATSAPEWRARQCAPRSSHPIAAPSAAAGSG
jgi:predicted MFS family arabinose efflux permease